MSKGILTKNPKETQKLAGLIIKNLLSGGEESNVVAFSGELGAGKTTLIQGLGMLLGIKEKIKSPTFVLMRTYNIPRKNKFPWKNLVHIDAYRLEKPKETLALGLKNIFRNRVDLTVIEWPEKIERLLPKKTLWIELRHRGKTHRHIFISN